MHNNLKKLGVALTLYILDNEILSDLVQVFVIEKITYQLATPCKHNKFTERVIQTHKAHFKAGLVTIDLNSSLAE